MNHSSSPFQPIASANKEASLQWQCLNALLQTYNHSFPLCICLFRRCNNESLRICMPSQSEHRAQPVKALATFLAEYKFKPSPYCLNYFRMPFH
ncbi:unnamed protein product [Citrullus colocynthis]|uniref:Uncharacterized protein n=1 Tax=Citrullus colocynthis TaxID=252529 RepID=A0ABP0Z0X2_9ROSI